MPEQEETRQPEQEPIGRLLAVCSQLCKQRVDERLQKHGITQAQGHMILYLIRAEREGEVNQRDLEKRFQVKAPTVNGIVERLEEKGFLTRQMGKRDGRCRCLTATDKGRELEREMYQIFTETEAMMLQDFPDEEKRQLRSQLERMIANLKGGTGDKC